VQSVSVWSSPSSLGCSIITTRLKYLNFLQSLIYLPNIPVSRKLQLKQLMIFSLALKIVALIAMVMTGEFEMKMALQPVLFEYLFILGRAYKFIIICIIL